MTLYQVLSLCGILSLIISIILSLFNYYKYKEVKSMKKCGGSKSSGTKKGSKKGCSKGGKK